MKLWKKIDEEDKANWDTNDPSIIGYRRDVAALSSTWIDYVRPKYKKALDRWNKETGGGDGTALSFIDYCGGDKWLSVVFCKGIRHSLCVSQ
jgi:hypothetical protein